jgi:hypothetical protein
MSFAAAQVIAQIVLTTAAGEGVSGYFSHYTTRAFADSPDEPHDLFDPLVGYPAIVSDSHLSSVQAFMVVWGESANALTVTVFIFDLVPDQFVQGGGYHEAPSALNLVQTQKASVVSDPRSGRIYRVHRSVTYAGGHEPSDHEVAADALAAVRSREPLLTLTGAKRRALPSDLHVLHVAPDALQLGARYAVDPKQHILVATRASRSR